MTTYKHTEPNNMETMSCHYLNIVIIKMYINSMFCGSLQLIEPPVGAENEAKDNMTSEAQWKCYNKTKQCE